jgi:hypothetical protein
MTDINDPFQLIRLAPDLWAPVDRLSHDLKRRYQQASAKAARGENVRQALKVIHQQAAAELAPYMLFRAARRMDPVSVGQDEADEVHGAKLRSLSELAQALADEEKRKEGIKPSAGRGG